MSAAEPCCNRLAMNQSLAREPPLAMENAHVSVRTTDCGGSKACSLGHPSLMAEQDMKKYGTRIQDLLEQSEQRKK